MRLTYDGYLGIGTTSPSYKLDVNGSTNSTTLYENGNRVITTANISSQSVNYATSAGTSSNSDRLGGSGPTGYIRCIVNPVRDVTINANELVQANTLYTSAGDMNSGNVTSDKWLNFPTPRPDGGYFLLNITENSSYKRQIYGKYSDSHLWVRASSWNSSGNCFHEWSKIALTSDIAWDNILSKPSTFTPSDHTHSNYCIKNSTIQVANIDIGGTTNGIIGTPYSSGDQNKYNFIKFNNANSDGGLIYTAGTWTSGDHIAHRFVVANIDPAMVIRNATGYVGIGVDNPDSRLQVNGNIKASKFIKAGSSDSVVLLGGGGDRAVSNFFYSSRDYIFHNITLTYNVWKRVLEISNNSGNGTNILFSVQCYHSNDVKSITWLITCTLGGGITITELSGKQYNNTLSIRVTSDNSYYYTTYIDLKKLSSSQNSAEYYIKAIKLSPNGQDIVTKDENDVAALTYSVEKQAGETQIPTDGKLTNSEIDTIIV